MHRRKVHVPPNMPPQPPKLAAPGPYTDAPSTLGRDGYVWEWRPDHPAAIRGVVLQHRVVMECHLGRFLTPKERVHHKDHVRWHNGLKNLKLHRSHAEHMREHWATSGRRDPAAIQRVREAAADPMRNLTSCGLSPTTVLLICRENGFAWVAKAGKGTRIALTEAQVREALQGRTTLQAAAHLGMSVTSLYNRFDHLLTKRTSPRKRSSPDATPGAPARARRQGGGRAS